MAYEFKLPDLGEGLSEGEVVAWKVNEGDSVAADQPLVSVLTDKAEVEIPSPKAGVILKTMAKPGQKIQVGKVFVVIGEKGETYSGKAPSASQGATASPNVKPASTSATHPGGSAASTSLPREGGKGAYPGMTTGAGNLA